MRCLSIALALLVSLNADHANGESPSKTKASFNFRNTPAENVLEGLTESFRVQFVPEVPLNDTLTLSSGGPVGVNEMVTLLDLTLRRQGAAARLEGGVVRIVPVSLASARVEMIQLKHADPKEVARIVLDIFQTRDLLQDTNQQNSDLVKKLVGTLDKEELSLLSGKMRISAVPYPRMKAVVIKAPEAAIGTIKQFILTALDKPTPVKPKPSPRPQPTPKAPPAIKTRMFKVNYVTAQYAHDTARKLINIAPFVEKRTNSLILRTNNYAQFDQLAELLKMIDIPEALREQTYHITLNNAKASEVRNVLNQLFSRPLQMPYSEEALEEISKKQGQGDVDSVKGLLEKAGVDKELAEEFIRANMGVPLGVVHIVADTSNNALLIRTSPKNIDIILKVVERMDQPQTQVFIKVFIAEVTLDDTLEMGLDLVYNDTGGSKTSTTKIDFDVRAQTTGLTYSLISNNFEAFFRLMQATTRLDIISTPHILTLDNRKGEIEFGKRVPLVQTTQVTDSGVTNSTVRYERVSTRLRVTPHVNAAGFIQLEIHQDIDDVSSDTFAITENLAPKILITRRAITNVQVRDGQTICLGGFIGDNIDEIEEKVPVLGDIPWVGNLFKKIKKTRVKNELLIFLTPYILRTPEELLAMTNEKRTETVVAQRPNRAPELVPSRVPERNPYSMTGRIRNSYRIPAQQGIVPPTKQPTSQPTTQPSTQPAKAEKAAKPAR